jgi:hypothetical protein
LLGAELGPLFKIDQIKINASSLASFALCHHDLLLRREVRRNRRVSKAEVNAAFTISATDSPLAGQQVKCGMKSSQNYREPGLCDLVVAATHIGLDSFI